MRIAVISDLHLGRRDAVDHFGHDDGEFLRFLRHLEGSFERIVLLGDIYETLTPRNPLLQRAELRRAREAHPEIVRRFDRPQYTLIHGNHDLVAASALKAPGELFLQANGVKLLFTHGHLHDWMIRRARRLTELGVCLGGWLRRVGAHGVFRAFDGLDHRLRGASPEPHRCSFQRWAMGLARQRDADVVVTGHTHIAARAEHGDRLFLNSGTCSRGRFSWLALDTAVGSYTLHPSF
jgi:predicted phosphodiesterase